MQKIIPCFWFAYNAEEAVKFYTTTFNNGKIKSLTRYPDAGKDIHGMSAGTVLTVNFEIENYQLVALNGGPAFTPNPSISFTIDKKEREEIDDLWQKLTDGGKILMPLETYPFSPYYGWVEDKYGISWQLILRGEGGVPPMPSFLFTQENAGRVDDAIDFYVSTFKNSKRLTTARYGEMGESGVNKPDDIAFADFILEGQKFAAMESRDNHEFIFNEAISFIVECDDQQEIDYYWEKLSAVPESEQCGWLKDKFGVSWQIVPPGMDDILNGPDQAKANRVMEAFLQMKKIDISTLKEAEGE